MISMNSSCKTDLLVKARANEEVSSIQFGDFVFLFDKSRLEMIRLTYVSIVATVSLLVEMTYQTMKSYILGW